MTEPTVSNVRVTARPLSEPREGLPPCLSMVVFEGRSASIRDGAVGCGNTHEGERFYVIAGSLVPCDGRHGHAGPSGGHDLPWCCAPPFAVDIQTDDFDEAKAAFERGAEYVRTGVLE